MAAAPLGLLSPAMPGCLKAAPLRLWRGRRGLWARWDTFVWVMVVPHLLLLPLIGVLWPIYLEREFALSKGDIGLVASSQHWLTLVGSPLLGLLIGRYGLRLVVAVHCCCFVLGAVVMATLSEWHVAIAWGVLAGLESRSVEIAKQWFLLNELEASRRGRASTAVGMTNKINYIAAPLLGAWIYSASDSFRVVYWCQAACGLLPLAAVLVFVPRRLGVLGTRNGQPCAAPTPEPAAGGPEPAHAAYATLCRQHGMRAVQVAAWGAMPVLCKGAYLDFVVPLRLEAAGVDPASINVLDAFNCARKRSSVSLCVCLLLPADSTVPWGRPHGHAAAARPGVAAGPMAVRPQNLRRALRRLPRRRPHRILLRRTRALDFLRGGRAGWYRRGVRPDGTAGGRGAGAARARGGVLRPGQHAAGGRDVRFSHLMLLIGASVSQNCLLACPARLWRLWRFAELSLVSVVAGCWRRC